MESESSDILGHRTMPVVHTKQQGRFPPSMTQVVWTSVMLLGLYVVGIRLWRRVLLWRERRYRLAARRRHGIPDNDLRPFNVAYNDILNRSRDEANRKSKKPQPARRAQAPNSQREVHSEQNLRNRSGLAQRVDLGVRSTVGYFPGGFNSGSHEYTTRNVHDLHLNGDSSTTASSSRNPSGSSQHINGNGRTGLARQNGYLDITDVDALSDNENDGKKRSLDEEHDEEHESKSKKTRVEGEELIDGDDDAEFDEFPPKRGSKRNAHDEDDNEVFETKKSRGKRARKVSLQIAPQDDMDVDEEEAADELMELKSSFRGKKRDRAAAGSTFGGDEEQSDLEVEADGDEKTRRRRKRRTVARRKSEVSFLRSKKYDREGENGDEHSPIYEEDSSLEKISGGSRVSRRQRGSDAARRHYHDDQASDVSMDESTSSIRSKTTRNIGDEWESNGIKYRIGPNGQRLRQTLVKKARQKFVMPKDSQHPDRRANLQVCVETWLTEEEYRDAKLKHLLAWQDSPKREEEDDEKKKLTVNTSNGPIPFPSPAPPVKEHGKNLLWSSGVSTPISPGSPGFDSPTGFSRERLRNSSMGLSLPPTSPFTEIPLSTPRRIASSRAVNFTPSIYGSPGLTDSTNGSPRPQQKILSKWEKQELEARAMMKIREATQKKEREREARLKEERERAERAAIEKQRLEKERADKEREAKEKLEKERAEADKKAKEAAASSSVPLITVTAPTVNNLDANLKLQATATTTTVPAAAPGGFNAFGVGKADPAPAPKTESATPSTAPTFFGNSSSATPTVDSAPKSTFNFGPSTSTTTGAAAPVTSTAKPNGFFIPSSSSTTGAGLEQKSSTTEASTSSSGSIPSLLSRLGPQHTPAASEAPKPSTSAFGSSASTTPASNPFGFQPSASPSTTSTQPTSGASQPLKFNFGVTNKAPAADAKPATTSAFPNSTSSTLTGALGSDNNANSAFKVPGLPASATNGINTHNGHVTETTGGPAFNFTTMSASPFGSKPTENKDATAAPKPASSFTFGNTGGSTTNAFGSGNTNGNSAFGNSGNNSNTNGPSTSVFGNTGTGSTGGSVFGNTGAFGANSTQTKEPTKSVFGAAATAPASAFGTTSGTSTFGTTNTPKQSFTFGAPSSAATPATGTTSTSKFSFGTPGATSTTPATTPAANTVGGFSFKFGATSTPSAGASTTPQASPFGAPAGQSVFGNLNSGPTAFGTTGGTAFGASATPAAK